MFPVKPRGDRSADEELAPVRVFSGVCHRYEAHIVRKGKVFVVKILAVDGVAAHAPTVLEVAALDHEVFDHAVENRTKFINYFSEFERSKLNPTFQNF